MGILAVVRLKGKFSLSPKVKETFKSLNLPRLYCCTLVPDTPSFRGMLAACKDFVSFGKIEKEFAAEVLSKRGLKQDGTQISQKDAQEIALQLDMGKSLSQLGVRPFVRLSPPKGGFGSRKQPAPFGPVGKNENISEIIGRMI
ncbi:MAG: uL30 family ribosomal protein [Candidatus Anstonellaceae archaeon]